VSGPSSAVNPEDRLFHLILALMSSSYGLTKDQILSTVRGYREDTEGGMARESIERRFERDKDSLRSLGIPLEATIPPEDDGNNKNTLYRIPKGAYDLPDDIEFSARDIALLNLAAAVWREGTLSKDARIAQMKLASFGITVDERLVGFAPVISTRDPSLQALRDAIDQGVTVSFSYLKPGDTTASKRTVSPQALVNHEGRWHLYSHEASSGKHKTFLLRRIVSGVALHTEPAVEAIAGVADQALADLEKLYQTQHALIEVTSGSDAWSVLTQRRGTTAEGSHLLVHYTDADIFAEELCSYGDDVMVLEPEALRTQVIAHLTGLVAAHG
jgi:proteasome accessory factor B